MMAIERDWAIGISYRLCAAGEILPFFPVTFLFSKFTVSTIEAKALFEELSWRLIHVFKLGVGFSWCEEFNLK